MADCSVLDAALRHNPLFFLTNPDGAKNAHADSESKGAAPSAQNGSAVDQKTPATVEDAASEAEVMPDQNVSAKSLGRRERKKRKAQALLQLIMHNDQGKTTSTTTTDSPPCDDAPPVKRARAEADPSSQAEPPPSPPNRPSPSSDSSAGLERLAAPSSGAGSGGAGGRERLNLPPRSQSSAMQWSSDEQSNGVASDSVARTSVAPLSSLRPEEEEEAKDDADALDSYDYKQLQQAIKRRRKAAPRRPTLELSSAGDHASLLMAEHSRTPLFLRDVQTLLLNACVPRHAPWPTRWCNLSRPERVSRTLAVVVEGLSVRHVQQQAEQLRSALTLLPLQTELLAPARYGTTAAEEVLNVPLSLTQRHRLVQRLGSLDGAVRAGVVRRQWGDTAPPPSPSLPQAVPVPSPVGRTQLLLDAAQLMEEGYPLPDAGHYSTAFQHFVPTRDHYSPVSDQSPMFAVDCEMCLTRAGSELTSISVLDESERLVYGTLVMPERPVTDYLTRWSGITADRLQGVTTRLEDVQHELRKLLPADAILIGQSLSNDLRALQMMHPYVIDTSVIFNITGTRQRKTKLSLLSSMFLGEAIQCDAGGHDATEDALAALRLVRRKLARGYTYGDAAQGGYVPAAGEPELEPEPEPLPAAVNMNGFYTSLLDRMQEIGVTTSIVANGADTAIYRVACDATNHPSLKLHCVSSNRQAADGAAASLASADLTLCHMELPAQQQQGEQLRRLDRRLKRLYRAAPAHTLMVVVGSGAAGEPDTDAQNGVCLAAVKQESDEPAVPKSAEP